MKVIVIGRDLARRMRQVGMLLDHFEVCSRRLVTHVDFAQPIEPKRRAAYCSPRSRAGRAARWR